MVTEMSVMAIAMETAHLHGRKGQYKCGETFGFKNKDILHAYHWAMEPVHVN